MKDPDKMSKRELRQEVKELRRLDEMSAAGIRREFDKFRHLLLMLQHSKQTDI